MNLKEYKEKLFSREKFRGDFAVNNEGFFNHGFDAAIELDLPVKFYEWMENWDDDKYIDLTTFYSKFGNITTKEYYQYWINNIYKIEK